MSILLCRVVIDVCICDYLCSLYSDDSLFFFLMIRRPPRSTLDRSSAASDVYKRQSKTNVMNYNIENLDILIKKDERSFLEHQLELLLSCLLYTSPSPRDRTRSRMPSSA